VVSADRLIDPYNQSPAGKPAAKIASATMIDRRFMTVASRFAHGKYIINDK
jgi:hypothetical protein